MKKSLFLIALIISSIVLSSCAGNWKWYKSGATQEDFRRDYAEAQYHAEVGSLGLGNAPYSSPFLNSYQKMGESAAHGVARGLERIKLINMYMEMKGWEKVYEEKNKRNETNSTSPVEPDLKKIEIASKYKISADQINILKKDSSGNAINIKASGKVVFQSTGNDKINVYCNECTVIDDEVACVGVTLIKRGGSVIRGDGDFTAALFKLKDANIKLIGDHELIND
jgi:hypothetical protein